MPDIQEQVAENRTTGRRLNGRFIDLPETANRNLSFARNTIEVAVTAVEVYTRPLNNALVSGHPTGSNHGSGHGESGDQRGGWTLQQSTVNTEVFTRDGRNAVRDSLDGQTGGGFSLVVIGTGTGDAATGDTTLESKTGDTYTWGLKDAGNEVRARSGFRFAEDGLESADLTEVGIVDGTGRLISRATIPAVSTTEEEEVRVDVTLTVSGSGTGNSVVTNDGEAAVADSIRATGEVVGINEIAFGTGTTDPAKSDSSLAAEEFRKTALRELDNERIKARVAVTEVEPNTQPVDLTEIGVFDNSGTPRLLWRVTFDALEKDSGFGFEASASYRIV